MPEGMSADDGIAEPPMHRLHGFPLAVVEERRHVLTGRFALGVAREARGELVGELSDRCKTARADGSVTRSSVRKSRHQYKYEILDRHVRTIGLNKVVLGLSTFPTTSHVRDMVAIRFTRSEAAP